MDKKPLISLIVPVYKAELHLSHCISSILMQTYTNFELILIDDGSPDNSGNICDQFANTDSRVHVYHKKNEGVSSARNLGIDVAKGVWVSFIDADDWIEPQTLSNCVSKFEQCEMIRFGIKYIFNTHQYVDQRINSHWSYNQYISMVVSRQTALGVWGGMYLRSIFTEYNIRFDSKYSLGEDWLVLFSYLKHIRKLIIIDKPLYNYNKMNNESATAVFDIQKFIQLNEVASIICTDNYAIENNKHYEIASLKANICGTCLATCLIKRRGLSTFIFLIKDMRQHNIYPSLKEIYNSILELKYKFILLFFSFLACIYPKTN